ncbi:transketolase-like TK C-terminal-containing protein [Candidatus Carsonella ruddii]|nr:hypothetical protein [Candidatus Carsonella ruddii]
MFFFKIINNVRIITVKIINNCKSGHPGMPLGMADIFCIFWYKFYKINFNNLFNKDKIVISNGHGGLIKYILLYYINIYNLKNIKRFRQINSNTPAHPEKSNIIDASTGPLGQGIGIGVGIGLKQKILKKFNNFYSIFYNKVWIFCGDGCLMEGVSNECISFCGNLNINNIIIIYDDNKISIDGKIFFYFNENIKYKFISLNWNVIGPINGHCYISIFNSLNKAKKSHFPTIIIFTTIIGFLSPDKSNTEFVHGSCFKKNEYLNILKNYFINFKYKKKFFFKNKIKYFLYYIYFFKKKFFELIRIINKIFYLNLIKIFLINNKHKNLSTRFISSKILENFFVLKEITIGSADLTSSNLTKNKKICSIKRNCFFNRYINYGVREFGMCLINYGLSVDSIGYNICSTFLVFMNYMYSAIRNISMSKITSIFLFTHDSFLVGQDGPSHQPIEQLHSLRIIPRLYVFRPYNNIEIIICWYLSFKFKKNCTSIILSRQNFKNTINYININNIYKGGYNLNIIKKKIDLIIISSGSDLEICIFCYNYLKKYFNIKIISIYCIKLFNKQKKYYKKKTLESQKILILESSNDDVWYKYKSKFFFVLNLKKFGKSGVEDDLKKYFNFTKKFIIKLCLYIINL